MPTVATYARFSTDMQRDSSIDDQRRNCLAFATRHGWPEPVHHFEDRAISGASKARPGYQDMLAEAERGGFDTLLVDDLSRLSRDDIETKTIIRRFKFRGLRIIGVSDGYDSDAKGEKIQSSMRGLMNEMYIDDLRDKVRRGMTGQAMKGHNVGGRCYGYQHVKIYDPARISPDGEQVVLYVQREIRPDHAEVIPEAEPTGSLLIEQVVSRAGLDARMVFPIGVVYGHPLNMHLDSVGLDRWVMLSKPSNWLSLREDHPCLKIRFCPF